MALAYRMKQIDLSYGTLFAELAQRSLDAQFQADFPLEGRYVTVPVKGRNYWYFDLPTEHGDKRRYVDTQPRPSICRSWCGAG